jgi:hypothetical protein
MEKETLLPKSAPGKDSLFDSIFRFDIPNLIQKIKQTDLWQNGELSSMILLKNPDQQIMLVALHENTLIKSYQSDDSIEFHLVEGRLRFHSRKESVTLEKGQKFIVREKIKYNLTTRDETIFLMTINKNNLVRINTDFSFIK